ncbi:transposase [Thermodesulfobacteriota bacterium]
MRKRRKFSGEEKVRILRRHLIDGVAVSDLCGELGLQPTVFYRWQKELFEHGAAAFERVSNDKKRKEERPIKALEAKIGKKDEVLAELMEEHVALKKVLGRSEGRMGSSRRPGYGGGFRQPMV